MASTSFVRGQIFSEVPEAAQTSNLRLAPDMAEIAQLAKTGLKESDILASVKACPRLYDPSEEDVAKLKRFGVSDKVIEVMRSHDKKLLKQMNEAPTPLKEVPAEPAPLIVSPKIAGGSPAAPGTAMRGERPLIRLTAPLALTNPPSGGKTTRPWTSSIVVEQQPPQPKLELQTEAPGPDYTWVSGYWMWRDRGWVWQSGYWLKKPAPNAKWVNGYWNRHARGWIWVQGQWM